MEIEELKENMGGMKQNQMNENDDVKEDRKHLIMEMKDEVKKIDPLLSMIEKSEEFVSMLFVNEFHNPNAMK